MSLKIKMPSEKRVKGGERGKIGKRDKHDKKTKTRYVFVTGGMSGLGKGLVSASIGRILQSMDFVVSVIKIDPYLNVDAGTMSPYEHGEVFVTVDGYEADQDLGTYERFLNKNLNRKHNITSGQVYQKILLKERAGEYLGRTVQPVPHVTNEIKSRIREVTRSEGSDFCVIEIGGTVGDIESALFLESARQLSLTDEVIFIHVTLVPELTLKEQKTKIAQHSFQRLRESGITPTFAVTRSSHILGEEARRKIALFCNVKLSNIISAYDTDDIYKVPINFLKQGFHRLLLTEFGLPPRKAFFEKWEEAIKKKESSSRKVRIGVMGKYSALQDAYLSIEQAFKHCEYALGVHVDLEWIEAEDIESGGEKFLSGLKLDGILVPGGFGSRGTEGKILAIKFARTHGVPFLGLCLGFQLAAIEFARNVLGLENANSAEFSETSNAVINLLEGQDLKKLGGTMRLGDWKCNIVEGTLARTIYGKQFVKERHRHRYEFNNNYKSKFEKSGMVFSGVSDESLAEMLELPSHKFFIASQFHPEFTSRFEKPAPLFYNFVKAAMGGLEKEKV